ncbi:50S ribosomal protein L7/L12 [Kiritimatiellaeota bacterium B1221]|nr:50S ribosomal protein L7/L12 [Kiritimatiellaeota bacterium B1221]
MSEETKTEAPELEGKMAEFVDWIETISVLELSKLVKALEDRLGVSAAAPVAAAAPAAGGGDAGGAAEEQSEFDVILTSPGGSKIAVIKELRAITGAGLKEAKEMAETADAVVKAGASKEEAEEIKTKLEAAGASVTVK